MNVDLSHVDTSAVKSYIAQTQHQSAVEFVLNIIPQTMVGAFADGNVLQVLLISVLIGFALTRMGESGKAIAGLIESVSRALFGVVGMVMWAAPLGAFGAIAFTVGKFWRAGSLAVAGGNCWAASISPAWFLCSACSGRYAGGRGSVC